jgi:NAD(P)-dependent dehydrogenase (short-subunit alcohol dehydrogenase family)
MREHDARVALVTGANRGMGLETSRQLLDRGLRVVMTGRDESAVERARRSLGDRAEHAIAVPQRHVRPRGVAAAARALGETPVGETEPRNPFRRRRRAS